MLKPDARLAILGAGPIGLEAALHARAAKLPFTVYERGRLAEYMQRWGHVRMFTPFAMNATPLGLQTIRGAKPNHTLPADDALTTGREYVASYLAPLAELLQPNIQLETHVLTVGRRGFLKTDSDDARRAKAPFRLLLRDKKGERFEEADIVLDCTGTYGQHRYLGEGGIPALGELATENTIAYGIEDVLGEKKNIYANRNILVVGAGYSAATTVCNLAQLGEEAASTWVVWLARCPGSQPMKRVPGDPLRERDRLAARANNFATRNDGNVEFHGQTTVETIETLGQDKGYKVTTRSAGKAQTWEVDRIIGNVGYSPDRNLYRELQIQECPRTFAPLRMAGVLEGQGGKTPVDASKTSEPGYFLLGAKSYGRSSNFLLRAGFEQVREVFALLAGKSARAA